MITTQGITLIEVLITLSLLITLSIGLINYQNKITQLFFHSQNHAIGYIQSINHFENSLSYLKMNYE